MHLDKRWIYIVFVLVFLPTPADAQFMSPSKLGSGKYNFRLGYVRDFGLHGMALGGERGFGDRTKVSTSASIFFNATHTTIDSIYESSQIVHTIPLGSTGLDCFFFGDFGISINYRVYVTEAYINGYESGDGGISRDISIRDVWLGGGGGLSKTLGRVTPFVGLFYQHNVYAHFYESAPPWYVLSMGAEVGITQHIGLTGRVEVWYEQAFGVYLPPAFYIGVSLH